MISILTIVLPVFGLILLGWLSAKVGYVSAAVGKTVAEFAFKVAMPALLFRAMVNSTGLAGSPLPLIATYFGAMAVVWIAATIVSRYVLRRPPEDSAVVAMSATFGNTVMLGIPLALSAFGEAAAAPIAIIIAIDSPLLWLVATMQIELAQRRSDRAFAANALAALVDIVRNPIVLSVLLGVAWRATGLGLYDGLDRWIAFLAQSAAPAALFALGTTLAAYRIAGEAATLSAIGVLKLVVFPLIALAFAHYLFELPPVWSAVAVLFAAMPVGANAFLFASRYERGVGAVSGAMATTTAIAVATLTVVLALHGAAK